MNKCSLSAAMTGAVDAQARRHLLRRDGHEDICFALWFPSTGANRTTALISRLILPGDGDRNVHGNASFEPQFFERAMVEAAEAGAGLALMHSHPQGRNWQGMSPDDVDAERGHAGAVYGATGKPLVGLTLAGDGTWSARFWQRVAPRTYERDCCSTVRVAGEQFQVSFNDALIPKPASTAEQIRTVAAWGKLAQENLARLKVGVIGLGSVGGMISESLARSGFIDVLLMDFDVIERHNLDRLVYATRTDVGKLKITAAAARFEAIGTGSPIKTSAVAAAVYEEDGFKQALDCDLLFSCVDRPWGRQVLNLIANAHLIPVIDGGIAVRQTRTGKIASADWRAHTATFGRRCLECLGQYLPSDVQAERQGLLDDPTYIAGLQNDHPLKANENVFAFSVACASLQNLQMLSLVLGPANRPNPGAQLYHFAGGFLEDADTRGCDDDCPFSKITAMGDTVAYTVTGNRPQRTESAQTADSAEKAAVEAVKMNGNNSVREKLFGFFKRIFRP